MSDSGFFKNEDISLYLYGALLGSAPMWIVLYLIYSTGTINNEDLTIIVLFFSSLISSAIAGYFVSRVKQKNEQSTIIITALTSYLIASLIFILYGYRGDLTAEMAVIAGYILGASLGGRFWEQVGEEYEYIEVEIDEDGENDGIETPDDTEY
jgi:hypothetical protein